jgi:hypothetical protein
MANSRRGYKGIASIFIAIATIEGPAPAPVRQKVYAPKSKATVRNKVDHAACTSAMVDRRETTFLQRAPH